MWAPTGPSHAQTRGASGVISCPGPGLATGGSAAGLVVLDRGPAVRRSFPENQCGSGFRGFHQLAGNPPTLGQQDLQPQFFLNTQAPQSQLAAQDQLVKVHPSAATASPEETALGAYSNAVNDS